MNEFDKIMSLIVVSVQDSLFSWPMGLAASINSKRRDADLRRTKRNMIQRSHPHRSRAFQWIADRLVLRSSERLHGGAALDIDINNTSSRTVSMTAENALRPRSWTQRPEQ